MQIPILRGLWINPIVIYSVIVHFPNYITYQVYLLLLQYEINFLFFSCVLSLWYTYFYQFKIPEDKKKYAILFQLLPMGEQKNLNNNNSLETNLNFFLKSPQKKIYFYPIWEQKITLLFFQFFFFHSCFLFHIFFPPFFLQLRLLPHYFQDLEKQYAEVIYSTTLKCIGLKNKFL